MATQQGRGDFGYGSIGNPPGIQQSDAQFGSTGQSSEFGDLAQQVSSAIFKLSNNVTTLEKTVRQIGTPTDSLMLRNRIQATLQIANKTISETTRCLKQLTTMALRLGKSSKLQVDRLNTEYHESIQRYSVAQKKVMGKIHSCPTIPTRAPPTGTDTVTFEEESRASLIEDARRQEKQSQLQQQDHEIEYDMSLLEEREEQIRQIEASMLDVNEIFRDLAAMISEQGEMVDSIEGNIDKAGDHVEEAATQLQTAKRYQKKARNKMCCCFIVLIVLALIITIILIATLK